MELSFYYLFIISIALILITKRYLQIHFSKPLALPILGHLHLLQSPVHQCLTKLTQKYGHIIHLRFGSRPVLLISSPSAAKECFTNNDIIFANRPLMLVSKHFGYNNTAVGGVPYGQHWRELRRFMATHALSPSRLPSFSSEVHSLVLKLYSGAGEGFKDFKKVEVRDMMFELMMNVILGLIAGKNYYGEGCGDPEEGKRFRKVVEEVFLLSGASTLEDFIPLVRWLRIGGAEKRMERVGKELDEFYQKIIEGRRRVGKWKEYVDGHDQEKKGNIIDVMLAMQEKDKNNYSDVSIKGMITSLLVAGTETTAGTMEWVMALLLNHPNALKKARAEIREQVGHSHLIKDSDISKLHYLDNVIKETLRLFPAGPLLVAHESSQDCTVLGSHIPKGTMLLVNAYAMQRDNQLWDNPLEFKPERFDSDDHVLHGDEGYKYIPFGTGRRRCPGESLAWKVMGLTLGALIQCFEWERVGKELVDLSEGMGLSMPMAKPLQAMYKPCMDMQAVFSQL